MTRELQLGPVPDQVDDADSLIAIFRAWPLALEIENFRAELYGSFEITGSDHRI